MRVCVCGCVWEQKKEDKSLKVYISATISLFTFCVFCMAKKENKKDIKKNKQKIALNKENMYIYIYIYIYRERERERERAREIVWWLTNKVGLIHRGASWNKFIIAKWQFVGFLIIYIYIYIYICVCVCVCVCVWESNGVFLYIQASLRRCFFCECLKAFPSDSVCLWVCSIVSQWIWQYTARNIGWLVWIFSILVYIMHF